MTDINKIISNAAGIAAGIAIEKLKEEKAHEKKPNKPLNIGRNFRRTIRGLNDEAKKVLDKAYDLRTQAFDDPRWVDIYRDWLKATDSEFHNKGGLSKLKAYAFYYKRWMVDTDRKDTRMHEFDTLHEYAQHELRRRTDIEYER